MPLSPATEDCLEWIWRLDAAAQPARNSILATRLGVTSSTVTRLLGDLSQRGLVEREPYRGATLTAEGSVLGARLIRRHRVIELFLVRVLGYGWDEVHDEAERLEHAVSDELVARLANLMGRPAFDPHGAPIPQPDASRPALPTLCVLDLRTGQRARVRRVVGADPAVLRYFTGLDLVLGAELEVVENQRPHGLMRLRVGTREHVLGCELCERLRVEATEDETRMPDE